jgi:membrane protein DedA with SNARE-associated domain
VPPFLHWVAKYGLAAIFGLLMFGVFGLPIPDETLLTFVGVMVREHHLHFIPALVTAFAGSACGITLSYTIGRTLGLGVVHRWGKWIHVSSDDLHRVEHWLEHTGRWILTLGYFIPGVRHVTALVAGASELPYRTFAAYAYPGAILWATSFITLGWYVGARWEAALAEAQKHVLLVVVAMLVPGIAYAFGHRWWIKRQRARRPPQDESRS